MTTAREHQTGLGHARGSAQAPKLALDRAGWITRFKRLLSDRVFASGDALARQHGWDITKTTTWSGFGGRIYRDLRFDGRRLPEARGAAIQGQKQASGGEVSEPWRPS